MALSVARWLLYYYVCVCVMDMMTPQKPEAQAAHVRKGTD